MDETVRRLILWHQSEIMRLSALLQPSEQDDDVLVYATPNNDVAEAAASPESSQDMFVTQRDPPSGNVFVAFLDTLASDEEGEGSH